MKNIFKFVGCVALGLLLVYAAMMTLISRTVHDTLKVTSRDLYGYEQHEALVKLSDYYFRGKLEPLVNVNNVSIGEGRGSNDFYSVSLKDSNAYDQLIETVQSCRVIPQTCTVGMTEHAFQSSSVQNPPKWWVKYMPTDIYFCECERAGVEIMIVRPQQLIYLKSWNR